MRLDLLLLVTIFLEIGFLVWYLIMAVTLFRSAWKEKQNGLTKAMAFLTISYIINTLWVLGALTTLPGLFLAIKIPADLFKAVMVTYFMWQLDFKERYSQWRDGR